MAWGDRPILRNVVIIAGEDEPIRKLSSELAARGFACRVAPDSEEVVAGLAEPAPALVLVVIGGLPASYRTWQLAQRIRQERRLPVIALLSRGALHSLEATAGVDDFAVEPWDAIEVALRAKRALQLDSSDAKESIRCGDLVVDLTKCEVSLGGRRLVLTFREYELLLFLASNRGRVFTREALLNKVWGYDYYGGDRTVDVHVRRLRNKLEDATHTFIETVRNRGYRFRDDM